MANVSVIKRGLFLCTRDPNIARKFHCLRVSVQLHKVDVSSDYPQEILMEEPIWVKVVLEPTSQNIIEPHGMYYWLVECSSETEISEIGIEYAKTAFQVEEYFSGLAYLTKRLNAQNIGLKFWKIARVSRFISEADYLIKVIMHEISHIATEKKLPQDLTKKVDDLRNSLEETASIVGRKKGYVETENHRANFYYFIIGNIVGFIISLFFQLLR